MERKFSAKFTFNSKSIDAKTPGMKFSLHAFLISLSYSNFIRTFIGRIDTRLRKQLCRASKLDLRIRHFS